LKLIKLRVRLMNGAEAIDSLVRWYCREAGVRNLEKHIEKVCRKLALEVISKAEGDNQLQDKTEW
jgi:Lon-like ATP-dependent protease